MIRGLALSTPVPANPGLFTMRFPGWSDLQGWSAPSAYSTIVCADVDGDGQAEIMGIMGGWLQTYHFDPTLGQWNRLADFQTQVSELVGIQAFDLDGDGQAELILNVAGGLGYVVVTLHFNNTAMTWSTDPYPSGPVAGPIEVACGTLGSVGQLFVWTPAGVYTIAYPTTVFPLPSSGPANGPLLTAATGWGPYASTMRCADVNGDGNSELLIRGGDGIHVFTFTASTATWSPSATDAANGPPLTDAAGWSQTAYESTIQLADIDGDGTPEIVASGPSGLYVFQNSGGAWTPSEATTPNGPTLNSATWQNPLYYPTMTCADVDGDGQAEIVARGPDGIYIFDYDPTTATWTPDSDAALPTGPAWSDAAGWGQPQYSLTVRAADVNGDGIAEIMGRLPDGVYTYQFSTDTSTWADASAPYPPLQPGAYTAISMALGIADCQLRTMYTDVLAPLGSYQTYLGNEDFLSSHDLDPSWQPSVDQLHAEVTSVLAVQALFTTYAGYLNDVTLSDKISLDSVATAIDLSQQVQTGSQSITADIFGLMSGIAWSLSALVPGAPALAVIAGLADSSLAFAISLPSGQGVPVNPVSETYENLNTQIETSFNVLQSAGNTNQATIIADYGLLMTIGTLIGSGQWTWPVDPTPDPETVAEAQYTLWAWQTLGAVAWTVYDAVYIDNQPVPGDRSQPSQYDSSWFWWGPKTPTPNKPFSTTQHARWLLLASAQQYAPVNVTVLQQLFGSPPQGLGVSVTDVLTGANGWAIPLGPS